MTFIVLLLLGVFAGIFMAIFIGANDIANAMGATLGCKALSLRKIIILAAIFELLGAILLGGFVAQTLSSGLLKFPTENVTDFQLREFMLAMVSVLIGSGAWLCIATLFSIPVSTTHSVTGSIIGCGIYMSGFDSVDWIMILKITGTWVLSPIIGALVAGLCWWPLKRFAVNSASPIQRIFKTLPFLAGFTSGILALFLLYKGLSPLKIEVPIYIALPCALAFGAIVGAVIWKFVLPILKKRIDAEIEQNSGEFKDMELRNNDEENKQEKDNETHYTDSIVEKENMVSVTEPNTIDKNLMSVQRDEQDQTEESFADDVPMITADNTDERNLDNSQIEINTTIEEQQLLVTEKQTFNFLVVITSCCIATAHGANDISNAAGPLGAIVWTYANKRLPDDSTSTEIWVTLITALGLVIGLATLGYRVMMTIGDKITKLTPSRAFVAQLATAFITLTASILGLPLSTTHIIVGAVYGISIIDMTSFRDLQWKMLLGILLSWVITIPASCIMSLLFFMLFRKLL